MNAIFQTRCQRGAVISIALWCCLGVATAALGDDPCDDGNPCTADSINAQGGCDNAPMLIDCNDGNACTRTDHCNRSGMCVGSPVLCDDGNPCTADTCDSTAGCQTSAVNNGTPCPDGDPCNGTNTCVGGTCMPGTALSCDDQNACTTESCVSGVGCVGQGVNCDDGNICNGGETCDVIAGCQAGTSLPNGTPCNDGLFCTGTDACQDGSCAHSGNPCANGTECNNACNEGPGGSAPNCYSPTGAACSEDGTLCTGDTCDGAGACLHTPVTDAQCPKGYAILRWPDPPAADVKASLGWQSDINGRICADFIDFRPWSRADGDAVAFKTVNRGYAVRFIHENNVFGLVATGGGPVVGVENAHIPPIDDTGGAPELADCHSAIAKATARRAALAQLSATQTFNSAIQVAQDGRLQIGVGPGLTVIDAPGLTVRKRGTLELASNLGNTNSVIIRVHGPLTVRFRGRIVLRNVAPEQMLFVVDGPIVTKQWAEVAGTLFGADHANIGWQTKLDGQLVAAVELKVRQYVTPNLHPWQDW